MLILAMAVIASPPPSAAAPATAVTPTPKSGTPPPQIYHIITRPLCSELHRHIAPAIALMLENDRNIKKGPDLFSRYNLGALDGPDNSASNAAGPNGGVTMSDSNGMTPSQNMALLGMENLVSPIANNIIATQKMLDTPALTQGTGNVEDDKQLKDIRAQLLKALATQNAALDIISGFVATQQMGDLQHAGQEYIAAVNQSDQKNSRSSTSTPTPNPLLYDPQQAGLPANPYDLNLAAVPGLTLGYNPVTRLLDALHWTIQETEARENDAAKTVMNSAAECAGSPPAPAATSKP